MDYIDRFQNEEPLQNKAASCGVTTKKDKRKFERLISSARQLNDIEAQLYQLSEHIGIDSEPRNVIGAEEHPVETLLYVLNTLPDEIDQKISAISELIARISDELN